MSLRLPYANAQEFITKDRRAAFQECEQCGWELYRCPCRRYEGECDFGGCIRPATHVAVQGWERRAVCTHDLAFACELGYKIAQKS
jgi:hypothetical protein